MLHESAHERNAPLMKFEAMLKTEAIYFFDSEDFECIIHHYLDSGKIALGKKAIQLGLEQHPASIELQLLQIEVLIFENKLGKAEKLLNRLEHLQISNAEIYIQKADIWSKRENHSQAVKFLQQALKYTDNPAELYSLIGMEFLMMDNYLMAKANFIKCLELDNDDHTTLNNIIYCFEVLEDYESAIEFLNIFLDQNPYNEIAWIQIGKLYVIKKMYKEALSSFDFAIISDDLFVGAYLEKGKLLEETGAYTKAIENYALTLRIGEPTSFVHLRMGKCYQKLGNNELARYHYHLTVKEDPLLDKGWAAIADYYATEKNYRKAVYYMTKALEINPENAGYWRRSAQLNHKLFLYEEADLAYRKAIELGETELNVWMAWADCLMVLGEHHDAIATLQKAGSTYGKVAEISYRLAGCWLTIGKSKKGLELLQLTAPRAPESLPIFVNRFPTLVKQTAIKNIITQIKNPSA